MESSTDKFSTLMKAYIVRHGERPPATGAQGEDETLQLTTRGRSESFLLGQSLREAARGVASSPVLRCRQTADQIALGAGLDLALIKTSSLLSPDAFSLQNLSESERQVTAQKLLEGSADASFQREVDTTVGDMHSYFASATREDGINVYVSHDWVMALFLARVSCVFERLSWNMWPEFGEYFVLDLSSDCICYRGVEYPVVHDRRSSAIT